MKLLNELLDDQYEDNGYDHIRNVVRAVVINNENQIALNKIHGQDVFGIRDYYELPGGGVNKDEIFEDAIIREIQEEIGFNSYIIGEVGMVIDFYNLIKRKNHNYFYICKTLDECEKHLEERELVLIEKVVWVDIDSAIELYKGMQDNGVGKLVKQRELPVLLKVRDFLIKQ